MPIYQYRNKKTNELVELYQKTGEAVAPEGHYRVFSVCGLIGANSGLTNELEQSLLRDYRTYEDRHGSGSVGRDIGLSEKAIKQSVGNYVAKYGKEDRENTEVKNGAIVE